MTRQRTDRLALTTVVLLAGVFALFFILPFAGLLDRALSGAGTWETVRSGVVRDALWLSLWTSAVTLFIAVLFGTPAAYLLSRATFRGKAVVDALIDLPIVLPPTVAGVALLTAFGRKGLIGEPIEEWMGLRIGFTTVAVIMAQLLVAAPFYVRAARAGFDEVDPQFEKVAYTLGASRLRTFWQVVAPQAGPALAAGMVLCWARAMGELGATLIFAGNFRGETQTMPLAIVQAFEGTLGLNGAVAISLVLLGVALIVLVLFRLIAARLRMPLL